MGKAKRATRKELEEVISGIIEELRKFRIALTALDNYVGLYIEWKGDKVEFPAYLQKKFNKNKEEVNTSSVEGNTKSGKKSRYRKISQPL